MNCKRCGGPIPNPITNFTPIHMLPDLCEQCKEQTGSDDNKEWSEE